MRNLRLVFVLFPLIGASAADNSLQATLARMDSAAAKYKGMKATITKVQHLEVMQQNDVETGTVAARRNTPKDLRMLINMAPPNAKQALLSNKVEVYYPKMNMVEEYELGKAASMKDTLLLLSFGSTSKEMLNAYTVSPGPAETVAGQKTTRLDLVPKDKQVAAAFPKIQLWISDDTGVAIQQRMIDKTGDYNQATYTNMTLGNVTEADVKLNIPPNAKRQKPLKP